MFHEPESKIYADMVQKYFKFHTWLLFIYAEKYKVCFLKQIKINQYF